MLGFDKAQLVSGHEKRQRMPALETALAYEAIFGVPIADLFAGMRENIISDVQKRRSELTTRLRAKNQKGIAAPMMNVHKLRSLGQSEQSTVARESMALL